MICLDFDWQIDEFMVYCRSTQLREKTMKSYEQTLRLFERWCMEQLNITTVDKVTESVIRHYIQDLQERGKYSFYANESQKETNCPDRRRDFRKPISTITINNYIRNLRVFFNWLDRDYVIKRNPMKKIRQLKVNRKAKEFLSDDELRRLLGRMDRSYFSEHRDYVMIMLMLDSGMRLGECSCLLVDDLELARRRVHLRAEITKGRQDRTVFFSEKTEKILRRWLQFKDRYVDSDYLFPVRERGSHIQVGNFEGNFKKYLIRAGLKQDFTPHCLRNNFAKRCKTQRPCYFCGLYFNNATPINKALFECFLRGKPHNTIDYFVGCYGSARHSSGNSAVLIYIWKREFYSVFIFLICEFARAFVERSFLGDTVRYALHRGNFKGEIGMFAGNFLAERSDLVLMN